MSIRTVRIRIFSVLSVVAIAVLLSATSLFAASKISGLTQVSDSVVAVTDSLQIVKEIRMSKGDSIVKTALQYLGVRYRRGMSGPKAFDCSGFTSYVFKKENIDILRTSRSQFTQGVEVADVCELQKGDLVFFGGPKAPKTVGHVGIVTDVDPESKEFKFIHACRRGVIVDESTSSYYSRRYLGARRIIED